MLKSGILNLILRMVIFSCVGKLGLSF